MAEPVLIRSADGIAEVRLNRPQAYNAFDLEMASSFAGHLSALAEDPNVSGVIITGEGKAFSAGADLKWALAVPGGPPGAVRQLLARFHPAILAIRRMKKPVIAAVNGIAAGAGFSLALACDFRVLARSAVLRQIYTSHGLSIDGGGTYALPRLVGWARALEIAAFDAPISSEQALAWGLASRVVADGRSVEEAFRMGRELSQRSLHCFAWSKQLLTDSFETSLPAQLEREEAAILACAEHPHGREGVRAFVEKREPKFEN